MQFALSDNVRLKGTDKEWQFQKKRMKKGEEIWEAFKYYSTTKAAFRQAVEYDFRMASDWDDFERRVHRLRVVVDRVAAALEGACTAELSRTEDMDTA